LPVIGQIFINSSIALEGTAILILVSVSLDTLRKVESRALMITYDTYDGTDFFQEVEPEKKKRSILRSLRRK
jgi:preprotein translocase subunit SecY